MLILILASTGALHVPAHGRPCKPAPVMARGPAKGLIHPLGAEPPATQVLALYREVGGCSAPIVVRRDVGTLPR